MSRTLFLLAIFYLSGCTSAPHTEQKTIQPDFNDCMGYIAPDSPKHQQCLEIVNEYAQKMFNFKRSGDASGLAFPFEFVVALTHIMYASPQAEAITDDESVEKQATAQEKAVFVDELWEGLKEAEELRDHLWFASAKDIQQKGWLHATYRVFFEEQLKEGDFLIATIGDDSEGHFPGCSQCMWFGFSGLLLDKNLKIKSAITIFGGDGMAGGVGEDTRHLWLARKESPLYKESSTPIQRYYPELPIERIAKAGTKCSTPTNKLWAITEKKCDENFFMQCNEESGECEKMPAEKAEGRMCLNLKPFKCIAPLYCHGTTSEEWGVCRYPEP